MMVVAKLTLSTSSKVLKHTLEVAMVSREKHHGIEFTRIYIYIYIYIYTTLLLVYVISIVMLTIFS